jgi:hypothetical protein
VRKHAEAAVALDDHSGDLVQVRRAVEAQGLVDVIESELGPPEVDIVKPSVAEQHEGTVVDPATQPAPPQDRDGASEGEQRSQGQQTGGKTDGTSRRRSDDSADSDRDSEVERRHLRERPRPDEAAERDQTQNRD